MGAFMNVLQLPWLFSGTLICIIFNHTQNIFPDYGLKISFSRSVLHTDHKELIKPMKNVQQAAQFQSLLWGFFCLFNTNYNGKLCSWAPLLWRQIMNSLSQLIEQGYGSFSIAISVFMVINQVEVWKTRIIWHSFSFTEQQPVILSCTICQFFRLSEPKKHQQSKPSVIQVVMLKFMSDFGPFQATMQ